MKETERQFSARCAGSIPQLSARLWLIVFVLVCAAQLRAAPTAFKPFPNNSTHSSASVAQAISNVPPNVGLVYDANGTKNAIQIWNFGTLLYTGSYDISSTLNRIRDGYWIATESNDGGFFNLRANELPNIPRKGNNYYMEFTVWPGMNLAGGTYDPSVLPFPSMSFPGSMRLLVGLGGEVYFTGDHYGQSGAQTNAYYVNPVPVAPQLSLGLTGANIIVVSWPATSTGFLLKQNTDLSTTNWVAVTNMPEVTNGQNQVAFPVSTVGNAFYRLQSQ